MIEDFETKELLTQTLKYPRPDTSKYNTNTIKTYLTENELDFYTMGQQNWQKMGTYLMAMTGTSSAVSIVLLNLRGEHLLIFKNDHRIICKRH